MESVADGIVKSKQVEENQFLHSHIIDDDRRKNAELFEDAFYAKNNLNPFIVKPEDQKAEETAAVDPELLAKVLGNPDMVALLTTLAKNL